MSKTSKEMFNEMMMDDTGGFVSSMRTNAVDYKVEPHEEAYQKAMDIMIGGTHYKMLPIEPWEIIERNNMGFFDGNALKYIMRFKLKNGIEDLKKARHYLDKLIEMSEK